MMATHLQNFLHAYAIKEDENIVVACSGGVDSMVLLACLEQIHPKNKIIVAHFNHALRAKESDRDEQIVRDFCKENTCKFVTEKKDIQQLAKTKKQGIEETARQARYAFLEETREKYQSRFVLVAHHLDDRIETCLFHLARGSKLGGLILPQEKSGVFLRPLLHTAKSEIYALAKELHVPFGEDSSNTDISYSRNRIRQNITSELAEINPNYRKAFDEFFTYAQELHDYLKTEASKFL